MYGIGKVHEKDDKLMIADFAFLELSFGRICLERIA